MGSIKYCHIRYQISNGDSMNNRMIRKEGKKLKKIKACPQHEYKFSRAADIKILDNTKKWDLYICVNCGLGKLK